MAVATLIRGGKSPALNEKILRNIADSLSRKSVVKAESDSIEFRPKDMEFGHFYFAELKGKPYLYRKVSEHEVEVYGLAEQT